MKRKTAKLLCSVIPISAWRKKTRKKLVFRYVLSDAEREKKIQNQKLFSEVVALVGENSVCIDCGANTGQETIPWAERGAEVHAFEPHPECFKILKERTAEYEKVHLYEKGVWHKNSTMNLYLRQGRGPTETSESSSILKTKPNVDENSYVTVEIIDLIAFIKGLNKRVDVLKIDIEGAEVELLQRIIDTGLYREIGLILVETHEQIEEIRDDLLRLRKLVSDRGIKNINLDWR